MDCFPRAAPGEIFRNSLRPTAIFGRAMARVIASLSERLGPETVNPAFHPTHVESRALLAALSRDPQQLPRPLVIINGYIDAVQILGFVDSLIRPTLRDTPIVPVTIGVCRSFAEARQRAFDCIDAAGIDLSKGVDAIGLSLGGVVAVDAACGVSESAPARRLNIGRLFAIGSPFTGVDLVQFFPLTRYLREMRPGSPFIRKIAAASTQLNIVPYAHRRDDVVGFEHAAPPGQTPRWLADESWFWPHIASLFDVRIVADIAQRLRS